MSDTWEPDDAVLAAARAGFAARAEMLAEATGLDADGLRYLAEGHTLPDPATDGLEHDDGTVPHLTDEEWQFVLDLHGEQS